MKSLFYALVGAIVLPVQKAHKAQLRGATNNAKRCMHIVPPGKDHRDPCCAHVRNVLDRLPTI